MSSVNPVDFSVRVTSPSEANYTAEARSTQTAAAARRTHVVKLEQIVFFATSTGDAWMLDSVNRCAACLAREGEILPIPIVEESAANLAVGWSFDYRIDGGAFTVMERDGGSSRTILGYPTAEIERLAVEHPSGASPHLAPALVARARLKGGRNEPCPCGSGRKYKKCCLANDEALVRHADAAARTEVTGSVSSPPPVKPLPPPSAPKAKEPRPLSATESRRNALWEAFDVLKAPTAAQMDDLLGNLLALPPDATDWADVVHAFASHGHPELPAVFRRVAGAVPHTKGTDMAFFYWAAAEEFTRKKLETLLPEVAAGFCKLDQHTYDADALVHLEDYLLASHFDAETLQLAEHFLPAAREGSRDGRLMPHVMPEICGLIFQLRVGLALRSEPDAGVSPELLAQVLRRDMEEEIDTEAARRAAMTICGRQPRSAWVRADFELLQGDISESDEAWQECLRLYDTLMGVARESWQSESFPPGCGFRGLYKVLESAYDARDRTRAKPKKSKRGNLLDYLNPAGLDERLARSCRGVLGVNMPRARLMLEAHELLLRFAERHQLVSAGDVAATQSELIRLRSVLDT